MILIGQFDSPPTRRVAISMRFLNIPYDRDTRSVFGDADALRKINPLGRIPILVLDDGEVLIESGAILDYLDDRVGPDRALVPARGTERRRVLQRMALAMGTLDKIGAIVYERGLRPRDKQYDIWLARCRTQVDSGLAALEATTADGWFLGGTTPGQADITLACVLAYLPLRAPDLFSSDRYLALARLLARAEALPQFEATRASADETMPDGI